MGKVKEYINKIMDAALRSDRSGGWEKIDD